MNCPPDDVLIEFAIGLDSAASRVSLLQHLASCQPCRERAAQLQHVSNELAVAHRLFDQGHHQMRDELLALFDEPAATRGNNVHFHRTYQRKGVLLMRRISLGVVTAALAVAIAAMAWFNQPPSVLAQATKGLREAKSYKCKVTVTMETDGQKAEDFSALHWAAPGSVRWETHQKGEPATIEIRPWGKPGIEIQVLRKTYRQLAAQQGQPPALLALDRLAQFQGSADRELDRVKIEGQEARGFEIAASKIDSDSHGEDKVRLWADPTTNRPLRVEFQHTSDRSTVVFRLDDFAWDLPTEGWFDTAPPAGTTDATPAPAEEKKLVEQITSALRTYAKYNRGHYPQVKNVYGDVTRDQLFKNAGVSQRPNSAKEAADPKYIECRDAVWGFSHINVIQRGNADAAYNGKSVGPQDKEKVLFRWKGESGGYHVIFGDLRHQMMERKQLAELEGR